jgi:hypothetical protein
MSANGASSLMKLQEYPQQHKSIFYGIVATLVLLGIVWFIYPTLKTGVLYGSDISNFVN